MILRTKREISVNGKNFLSFKYVKLLATLISTIITITNLTTMSKGLLLPQCFLLPGLWEPKGSWIDTRIERKKLSEILCQRVGRVDEVQPITNDGKNKIGALCSCGRLRNEGVARMTRHQRAYAQCPVPKAGMMGADVA